AREIDELDEQDDRRDDGERRAHAAHGAGQHIAFETVPHAAAPLRRGARRRRRAGALLVCCRKMLRRAKPSAMSGTPYCSTLSQTFPSQAACTTKPMMRV